MKHLEEMLAKEQARTKNQNTAFQTQMLNVVNNQLNHNTEIEHLKFKNDQILKFKSVPTTADYRKFLAKIDPGKVKAAGNAVPKKFSNGSKAIKYSARVGPKKKS